MRILLFAILSIIGSSMCAYAATTDFVFTIKTDNTSGSSSGSSSFTIPTNGSGYSYQVDWGDGIPDATIKTGSFTHPYTTAGTYIIRISGTFPSIYFNNTGDLYKMISIDQWGSAMNWTSFANAFFGCSNMTIDATDAPVLKYVTNLNQSFSNCNALVTGNFGAWDVHTITDMGKMFYYSPLFNDNIGSWVPIAVTNMSQMFAHATAFNNMSSPSIGSWNTASVLNMYYMFNATAFNQNIGAWPTATVTNMAGMFQAATAFNQDISSWNTAAVNNMQAMFSGASKFNQNISTTNTNSWNTAAVTDMSYMLQNTSVFNQNIGNWNTAKVSNMANMLSGASVFNNLGSSSIGSWNTAAVTNMSSMFYGATAFNQNISTTNTNSWNTAAVTNMSNMFLNASAFNQNIGNWNTAKVTNMSYMFYVASAFNQDISTTNTNSWNTASVTNMSGMFDYASAFNQNIGNWNTAKVTNMSSMFNGASAFNQNISTTNTNSWNTAAVTDMSFMFYSASAFNQNIGNWNTAKVTNMNTMLDNAGMSVTNYDNTLIGWQGSPHSTGISLGAAGLHYCASSIKRALLANNDNWSFTDTYLYAGAVPTLAAANTSPIVTANGTCTNATGYQQFMDKLSAPTANYMAINPNGNTGYSFTVTAANNNPTVNNQHLVNGQNTTALANRMYTVVDAGTDNYSSGMTVRIYYAPADTTAAIAALDPSTNPLNSQWFKISGSTHAANVATILSNQTASTITGATFLVPSARGVEGGVNYVEFSGITSFSTFGYLAAKTSATLLPVTLANFKGMASGCTANLSWQSSTESNNSYYGIEESGDGSNFAQVAKVNSGNSANGAAYTHAYPLQGGTNYFRLKMVDLDGRFSYSPTVAIVGTGACGTQLRATVSPNPTSDVLNIAGLSIGSTVTLYDTNGKKIKTLLATATRETINVHTFTKGIYMLQIQKADGTVETLKVVTQ